MDPCSYYVLCFGTTLASSPPSFGVGFYDTTFHTISCGLFLLGQDVPKKYNELKDLNCNMDNLRGLA